MKLLSDFQVSARKYNKNYQKNLRKTNEYVCTENELQDL